MTMMPDSMTEATRLTREGKLFEATALIQRLLSHKNDAATPSAPAPDVAAAQAGFDLYPQALSMRSQKTADNSPASNRPPMGLMQRFRSAKRPTATSGTFSRHTHFGMNGSLDYMVYAPSGLRANAPLVVMLHGCTQTSEDFARGTAMNRLADEEQFVVVYPEQSSSANMQRCWNWFRAEDQTRDQGEPQLIAGVTHELIAEYECDPARVYVAGLSAGGAAAAIMAETYPDIYAACGVHSGLAHGAADNVMTALSAMRQGRNGLDKADGAFVPTIVFHGDHDKTVADINSAQIIAAAAARVQNKLRVEKMQGTSLAGKRYTQVVSATDDGVSQLEQWTVHGLGHAWSGGEPAGSYTDPAGPDASREMLRFFRQHRRHDQ